MVEIVKANVPAIIAFVVLGFATAIMSGLFLGEKTGDAECKCTTPSNYGWVVGGIVLIVSFMAVVVAIIVNPSSFVNFDIKSNKMMIAVVSTIILIAVTGWSLYGRSLGDPTCNCSSKSNTRWNWVGAILTVIICLFMWLLLLAPGFLFKGGVEEAAQSVAAAAQAVVAGAQALAEDE